MQNFTQTPWLSCILINKAKVTQITLTTEYASTKHTLKLVLSLKHSYEPLRKPNTEVMEFFKACSNQIK